MSAPRKSWAEVFKPDENGHMLTVAGNYVEADGASIPYHHDDVVRELVEANKRLGFWMSAALEDPNVSDAMKVDIGSWFAAFEPHTDLTAEADAELVVLLKDCEMDALGWAAHAPALREQGYDADYSAALALRIRAALAKIAQEG